MFLNNIHNHSAAVDNRYTSLDYGIPWHFGNPLKEQRQAIEQQVIVDRSNRKFIKISGPESLTWLNGLVTKDLTKLTSGDSLETLILDSKGHITQHFCLTVRETGETTEIWLDTESYLAKSLYNFLHSMLFWAQVKIDWVDTSLLTILGKSTAISKIYEQILEADDKHNYGQATYFWWRKYLNSNRLQVDLIIPPMNFAKVWNELLSKDFLPIGSAAYEALRVKDLQPRLVLDTDLKTLPHELNWVNPSGRISLVDFNQGCYLGQETVARIENMGQPPRILCAFLIDNPALETIVPGSKIYLADRMVGRMGSVVEHYEWGLIGLGLIKRSLDIKSNLQIANTQIGLQIDTTSLPAPRPRQAGKEAIKKWKSGKFDGDNFE